MGRIGILSCGAFLARYTKEIGISSSRPTAATTTRTEPAADSWKVALGNIIETLQERHQSQERAQLAENVRALHGGEPGCEQALERLLREYDEEHARQ